MELTTICDELVTGLKRTLSLLDTNPLSPTYGCFDKQFWHFKRSHFLNGMMQKYLSYLSKFICHYDRIQQYTHPIPISKQLLISYQTKIIEFTLENLHKDGTLDEHYHNEHSLVATIFVYISLIEAIEILDHTINNKQKEALGRMFHAITNKREIYPIGNHQMGLYYAIIKTYYLFPELLQEQKWQQQFSQFAQYLGAQKKNGWFLEYDGCDLGYETYTFQFLVKIWILLNNSEEFKRQNALQNVYLEIVEQSILKQVKFFEKSISFLIVPNDIIWVRSTNHFFIEGFLLYAKISDNFRENKTRFIEALIENYKESNEKNRLEYIGDDVFHWFFILDRFAIFENNQIYLISRSEKLKDHYKKSSITSSILEEARVFISRLEKREIIISWKHGLHFSISSTEDLEIPKIYQETGLGLEIDGIKYLPNSTEQYSIELKPFKLVVEGKMSRINKTQTLSPFNSVMLTIFGLTIFKIERIRRIAKKRFTKKLIMQIAKEMKFHFEIVAKDDFLEINNTFTISEKKFQKLNSFILFTGNQSVYTPSGRNFHPYLDKEPRFLNIQDIEEEFQKFPEQSLSKYTKTTKNKEVSLKLIRKINFD